MANKKISDLTAGTSFSDDDLFEYVDGATSKKITYALLKSYILGDGTGALIVPSLTTAQRDALSPSNGMIIYNTTDNRFEFRENGAWEVPTWT